MVGTSAGGLSIPRTSFGGLLCLRRLTPGPRGRNALPPVLALFAGAMLLTTLYLVFMWVPTERTMGILQRIFYFKVGSAFVCIIGSSSEVLPLSCISSSGRTLRRLIGRLQRSEPHLRRLGPDHGCALGQAGLGDLLGSPRSEVDGDTDVGAHLHGLLDFQTICLRTEPAGGRMCRCLDHRDGGHPDRL